MNIEYITRNIGNDVSDQFRRRSNIHFHLKAGKGEGGLLLYKELEKKEGGGSCTYVILHFYTFVGGKSTA